MPLNPGHAPIRLMEPYLNAIRQRDREALRRIWGDNPGYVWGRFTEWLSREDRSWMHYEHQDWIREGNAP